MHCRCSTMCRSICIYDYIAKFMQSCTGVLHELIVNTAKSFQGLDLELYYMSVIH